MLEVLTATGLATAAGLNAGLPLLVLGAAARWTTLVELPAGWTWLSEGGVLAVLAVLVLLDVVADKVPGVDHLNDVAQTVVRPTSGGLAFGAGVGAVTPAVQDPAALADAGVWVPVLVGVVLALVTHLTKAAARPVVSAATLGIGGPVVSAVEDVTSVSLSLAALLLPVLVVVLLLVPVVVGVRLARRRRQDRPPAPA
nr:DUF4126 domain-containing protein [uncultured Actinotalea sp.]